MEEQKKLQKLFRLFHDSLKYRLRHKPIYVIKYAFWAIHLRGYENVKIFWFEINLNKATILNLFFCIIWDLKIIAINTGESGLGLGGYTPEFHPG